MKKILVPLLLLLIFMPFSTYAALQLSQSSTDKIVVTNPLTYGSGVSFTYIWWMKQRGIPPDSHGTTKGVSDVFVHFTNWFMSVPRATTASQSEVSDAVLFPNGNWTFVAETYSETNGVKIYRGSLTSAPVEVTYAVGRTVGSGATSADSGDLYIGNRGPSNTLAPPHDLAMFQLHNAELTLAQIRQQWMRPRKTSTMKLYFQFGFNGTGTQTDYSGNGKNGTVTGTTKIGHVPIAAPFGR